MNRFIFFFRGSTIQDDDSWTKWIGTLKASGHFIEGAPLLRDGVIVMDNKDGIEDFIFNSMENASGFVVVQATDIEEAKTLTKDCPVFKDGGTVTIRPIVELY